MKLIMRIGFPLMLAMYPVSYWLFFRNDKYIDCRPGDALLLVLLCNIATLVAIVGGASAALWVGLWFGAKFFTGVLVFSYVFIPTVTWVVLNIAIKMAPKNKEV